MSSGIQILSVFPAHPSSIEWLWFQGGSHRSRCHQLTCQCLTTCGKMISFCVYLCKCEEIFSEVIQDTWPSTHWLKMCHLLGPKLITVAKEWSKHDWFVCNMELGLGLPFMKSGKWNKTGLCKHKRREKMVVRNNQ